MILVKNKVDIFCLSVQLYGIDLCRQFMGYISLVL